MRKKVLLIWDLDGGIGQINSTYPYNYNFKQLARELDNVRYALDVLDAYKVKSTFAITGFSAEEGVFPYTFPDLIAEIKKRGHEVASHSWRHEWIPLFTKQQISKSVERSKGALEKITGVGSVVGFIPPHNRPMTWLSRAALSIGDRGIYPFFEMGDMGSLLDVVRQAGYKWIRVSHRSLFHKIGFSKVEPAGVVTNRTGMLILENHYVGFDQYIIDHIKAVIKETYTISAHPLMLDFPEKGENKLNLVNFLKALTKEDQSIDFVCPSELIK